MQPQGCVAQDLRRRRGPRPDREVLTPGQAWERALELLPGETPVVDLWLDQRVAAGIGNVYKSEVLCVARRSALLRLHDLKRADISTLYRTGGALLNQNLTGEWRQRKR